MSNRPPSAAKTTRRRRDGAVGGADHFHGRLGGTPVRVDATAQLTQARGACGQLVVSQGDARETNTCSKASLLLSFGQMAVGVKVGVGVGGRVGGFRPSFPLDEVGDPALGQGGGLRHVVSDCLRNTCDRQRKRRETSESEAAFKNPIYAKFFFYRLGRTWPARQTPGCLHFSSSRPVIFPTLESFHSPQVSPVKKPRLSPRIWCETSVLFVLSSQHKSASQT